MAKQSKGLPRRQFLRQGLIAGAGLTTLSPFLGSAAQGMPASLELPESARRSSASFAGEAVVISTWNHGLPANAEAWKVLEGGASALDAAEAGVRVPEADPESMSVGYGGLPDREGIVSLDACIMDDLGRCGGVCFLQGFMHPISVARRVMEQTPHVLLAGKGAEDFAAAQGFERSNLLTPQARQQWKEWLKEAKYIPDANLNNHDTIGLLALDQQGRLAGACTTSGLAYKMHGRVGDSPIIGAGLYVDGEVGAATATGVGEMVIKICGSFLIVELMRQGASAQEACETAIRRIASRQDIADQQVGFLALDTQGQTGAFSIHPGFNYALTRKGEHRLLDSGHLQS